MSLDTQRIAQALEKQAAALERIAVAVEALSAVLTAKPVVIPAQPMRRDVVIGPGRWEGSETQIELDRKRTR